ncbi:MAG: hypothetical protein KGI25_07295 [Thaumarchaeota archaeon]|nr:hypothetical protein [Nitrososphaerota archaeon]
MLRQKVLKINIERMGTTRNSDCCLADGFTPDAKARKICKTKTAPKRQNAKQEPELVFVLEPCLNLFDENQSIFRILVSYHMI